MGNISDGILQQSMGFFQALREVVVYSLPQGMVSLYVCRQRTKLVSSTA